MDEFNKTATKVWEYRYTPDIYMSWMGSAYRLPNGNTLINWGGQKIVEVRPDKSIAFEITLYSGFVYRAFKIGKDAIIAQNSINSAGEFNFSQVGNETGVSIQVSHISTPSAVYLQRHEYAPHIAKFSDSLFSHVLPHRWVLTRDGKANLSGKIKINVQSVPGIDNPSKITIYKRDKENDGDFYPLTTVYNSGTGQLIADFNDFGEFVIVSNVLEKPKLLSPINNVSVNLNGELKWQKVQGADRYQIHIDTADNFALPIINSYVQQQLTYNYSGLKQKTKYYWRVRALNNKDTSDWSNIFAFTTISPPPVLIYPLDKSEGIALADTLKWLEIDDKDIYFVQIATSSDFKNPIVSIPNHSSPFITISNLRNETTYYWRVLVNHPQEPSDWSAIRSFKTTFVAPNLNLPFNQATNVKIPVYCSWNTDVSVDSYTIEISEFEDFLDLAFSSKGVMNKSIDVSSLKHDTEYFWRVKSKRGNIYSDWSYIHKFTTILVSPRLFVPSDYSTEVALDVELTWEMPILNVTYNLQLASDISFNNLLIDTLLFSKNNANPSNLLPNTRYFWRVRIINGDKIGDWSQIWNFTTINSNKLQTPKLLYPWNFAFVHIEGILNWNAVEEATRYQLQIDKSNEFSNPIVTTILEKNTSYFYSKLDYSSNYFWRVRAFNDTDSSDWSSVRRFTTMEKVDHPTLFRPVNDQMQVPLNGFVECFYVPAIDYYVFQISETPSFDAIVKEANVGLNRRMEYDNLEYNKRYYWRAAFFRDGELSSWSNVWTFMSETEDTIVSPRALTPNDFTLVNPIIGLDIRWSSVEDATSYVIALSSNWSFDAKVVKYNVNKDTNYLLTELDFKNFYYWRVSAIKEQAQSAWSNSRNFVTMLKPPVIIYPENDQKDIPFDGRIVWFYDDTSSWFRFQIATDINFENIVLQADSIRAYHHDYVLEKNTEYYIRMRAFDFFNRSVWTEPMKFITGSTTNIADNADKSKYKVYPNPAKDYIIIENGSIKSVKIVDLLGNEAYISSDDFNYSNGKYDISNLSSGVYIIILTDSQNNTLREIFVKYE